MPFNQNYYDAYLKSLDHEIKNYTEAYDLSHIKTIYIGGGTPSLKPDFIKFIAQKITSSITLSDLKEYTVECNPLNITRILLDLLKSCGVNRISFGIQSFNEQVLDYCNRTRQDNTVVIRALDLLRQYDFSVSIDLICGLPLLDYELELRWLERILETYHNVNHVSFYGLSVEEGSLFYQDNDLVLPEESVVERFENEFMQLVEQHGFERYEVSNFARNGYYSYHNLTYWNYNNYLGLGPAAHSKVGELRIENQADIAAYNTGKDYQVRYCLSKKEQLEEFLLMGLRLSTGVKKSEIQKRYQVALDDICRHSIDRYQKTGLLDSNEDRLWVTGKGMNVLNKILVDFFCELDNWQGCG